MKKCILLSVLCLTLAACGTPNDTATTSYGTDYESTWGDLIKSNGGDPVWGTLTEEQQALVHYPYFDKEKVYWTPEGENYHSVDWCYTLERSKEIISGTYDEAVGAGLDSCSKCVGE